ncbi:hypothetical protein Bhyg_07388, partial [Pseudolycoriella hygida]
MEIVASAMSDETVNRVFAELWDTNLIPQEWKDIVVDEAGAIASAVWKFISAKQFSAKCSNLEECLNQGPVLGQAVAERVWNDVCPKDGCKESFLSLTVENYQSPSGCSPTQDKDKLCKILKNHKKQTIESAIKKNLIFSSLFLANEVYALHTVWLTIKDSDSVIDECKSQLPNISKQMNDIIAEVNVLKDLIEQFSQNTKSRKLEKEIDNVKGKINSQLYTTKVRIGEIKIKVENKVQKLASAHNQYLNHGASNTIHFFSNLSQLLQGIGIASNGLLIGQGVITTAFAA